MVGDEYAAGAYVWGCPYIPGSDASTVAGFAAQPVAPSTAKSSSTVPPRKSAQRTFANVAAELGDYPDVANFRCAADAEAAWLPRMKHAPNRGVLVGSAGLDTPFARTPEHHFYVGNRLAGSLAGCADGEYPGDASS